MLEGTFKIYNSFVLLINIIYCLFFLLFLLIILIVQPRVVKIGPKYAVHRNFGLSMQVGGYIHGYVMDVLSAAVMQEQFDNTRHYDARRPTFLKYIMPHEISVSLSIFFS